MIDSNFIEIAASKKGEGVIVKLPMGYLFNLTGLTKASREEKEV